MKTLMTSLLVALLAILTATPVLVGQQAQPTVPDTSPPVFSANELILRYYSPQVADSRSVTSVMERFYRREFYVKAEDGSISGPVRNIQAYGDSVMVYDTPEFVDRLLSALESLEEATANERDRAAERTSSESLVVAQYSPRYQTVRNLVRALEPFRHDIVVGRVPSIEGFAHLQTVSNITSIDEPATLVLRDTPDTVAQMIELLERIDLPAPQMMITVWLLRGSHEDDQGQLPAKLVDNLARLVPYPSFTRESIGMLRSSIVAGQTMSISGDVTPDDIFELTLIPSGYDIEKRQLALTSCEFSTRNQFFSTSTVVRAGEYTVLGATGSDPVFVVLQVSPLDD